MMPQEAQGNKFIRRKANPELAPSGTELVEREREREMYVNLVRILNGFGTTLPRFIVSYLCNYSGTQRSRSWSCHFRLLILNEFKTRKLNLNYPFMAMSVCLQKQLKN